MLTKKSTVILCLFRLQELFDQHTAACTMQNWKYWVFSRVMQVIAQLHTTMETATEQNKGTFWISFLYWFPF